MKKLKLSLDDLEVESFETTPEIADTKGTVVGYGGGTAWGETCVASECGSCGGTCFETCGNTCGGTCGRSCGGSCVNTCLGTCLCPPGPSGEDTCWAGCSISNPC